MVKGVVLFMALVVCFSFSSCKKSTRRVAHSSTKITVKKTKVASFRPSLRVPEGFSYTPFGLRDPFEPPGCSRFLIHGVVGVLEGKGPRESCLLVKEKGGMRVVKPGDRIQGYRVLKIRKDRLLLEAVRVMPWGERRVEREWVPLKIGGAK